MLFNPLPVLTFTNIGFPSYSKIMDPLHTGSSYFRGILIKKI